MFDLSGQVALVTGASRGIGEAAARSLVKYGAKVVLAARSAKDIERIAAEINEAGWQRQGSDLRCLRLR